MTMAGRKQLRWCSVTCLACGHEGMIEAIRRRSVADRLRCSQCGERKPRVQWIKPERRTTLRNLPQRQKMVPAQDHFRCVTPQTVPLEDKLDDLWSGG
jgi:hypothetical protein